MDLKSIILSEVRQRKTNSVCYHICGIKKIKESNVHNKTEKDSQQTGYQWGEGIEEEQIGVCD